MKKRLGLEPCCICQGEIKVNPGVFSTMCEECSKKSEPYSFKIIHSDTKPIRWEFGSAIKGCIKK